MIKVKLYTKNLEIQGFKVTGHALYAPEGKDIVCAAVSMVTQTALLGLTEYLKLELKGHVEKGQIQCILPSIITYEERLAAKAILETMSLGIYSIAKDYPKIIEVHKEEVPSND